MNERTSGMKKNLLEKGKGEGERERRTHAMKLVRREIRLVHATGKREPAISLYFLDSKAFLQT